MARLGAAGCLALDAASDVGEVEPDFYAAKVGAFGADGSGDTCAKVARRADKFRELWMDFLKLRDFVKRGLVDFFLSVKAGAHGPFVEKVKEGAGLNKADGFCVGKKIERDFERDAAIKQFIFGVPRILHGAIIHFT